MLPYVSRWLSTELNALYFVTELSNGEFSLFALSLCVMGASVSLPDLPG